MSILFTAKIAGLSRLRAKAKAIEAGAALALSKGTIENFILQRARARFAPAGTNPTAQKDPDGRRWPPNPRSTTKRRRYNKRGDQALYDSGTLAKSIVISTRNTFLGALRSAQGGVSIIGVSKGSPASSYASLMQNGGYTPRGGRIPARKFIGIGAEDVRIIDNFVYNVMDKAVRR